MKLAAEACFVETILRILPEYFQNTSRILPEYFQNTSRILPEYFQNTSRILPAYFQHVYYLGLKHSLWVILSDKFNSLTIYYR